eukprot:g41672.t1
MSRIVSTPNLLVLTSKHRPLPPQTPTLSRTSLNLPGAINHTVAVASASPADAVDYVTSTSAGHVTAAADTDYTSAANADYANKVCL